MVETRQSRQTHQQQGLPVQPFAALNIFASEQFLPQLPAIKKLESTVTTTPVPHEPKTDQSIPPPFHPADYGLKLYAIKYYTASNLKKGTHIIGEKHT